MPSITVVLADSEKARRAGCRRLLQPEPGIQVVGEVRSGLAAIAAAGDLQPHILLLSLSVSRGNGVALLPVLRQKSPRTKVILLTRRASQGRILEALSRGARGYLDEKGLRAFLPKAVRSVDAGEAWVPRKMVVKIMRRLRRLRAPAERRE